MKSCRMWDPIIVPSSSISGFISRSVGPWKVPRPGVGLSRERVIGGFAGTQDVVGERAPVITILRFSRVLSRETAS